MILFYTPHQSVAVLIVYSVSILYVVDYSDLSYRRRTNRTPPSYPAPVVFLGSRPSAASPQSRGTYYGDATDYLLLILTVNLPETCRSILN